MDQEDKFVSQRTLSVCKVCFKCREQVWTVKVYRTEPLEKGFFNASKGIIMRFELILDMDRFGYTFCIHFRNRVLKYLTIFYSRRRAYSKKTFSVL